ncbi:MAG: hypothetical protein A3H96_03675 [Acidobacteria bacterium RIFCSPLOWO2_02_FULL_67_36]|nr:MAG: hypothetical protein A3H96_03675 [Acidobacteria bacterium RIFCSPLOWO2_02_FULL_67_36]OFW24652.1 MAG: hypothetical protein A3G21_17040 [Acidobacteria bacterium RIFCSPLOWO2_12_FULL_66_21]
MRRVAAAAALALTIGAGLPRAQEPATLEAWLDAVRQHTPGERDDAVDTVGAWSRADLAAVHAQLRRLEGSRRGVAMAPLLLAGAMLHTDIAMLTPGRKIVGKAGDPSVQLSVDGRDSGRRAGEPGWPYARQLLDAAAGDLASHPTISLWYRATTAYMAANDILADAEPHLEHARRILPLDADVWFNSGWLFEAYAHPRTQALLEALAPLAGTRPPVSRINVVTRSTALQKAEAFYTRAIELDPSRLDARIHRGRIRSLRGRQQEAIADLHVAAGAARGPSSKYLAALFLGGAYDALDDLVAARNAYHRAAAIYPLAQSPHLALSRLATRRGDLPESLREVQQVLRLSPDAIDRGDPWWTCDMGNGIYSDALVAELRAAIRRIKESLA